MEDKSRHHLNTWPRSLLRLPLIIRVTIVGGTIALSLLFYIVSFTAIRNGNILVAPTGVSAWIFKKKGLFIFEGSGLFVLTIYHVVRLHGLLWPLPLTLTFIGGFIILTIIGYIIIALRELLDASEDARLKAQQAEQQTSIAYEQQRQLNELKNQFILNVNHELRSPLTVISSYLSLLLDKQEQLEPGAQERYLKNAIRSCKELQTLTDDVLDTLVLSNNKNLPIEDITIISIAREAVEYFTSIWNQKRRTVLDISESIIARGNTQCLRHVLRNLLSNAYKYSPPDKPVIVSATPNPSSNIEVWISVKDEGPGIPPDQIPLLFGQFVRLERDLAGSVRGSGLGLYISKNLVEAMSGHIWAESTGIAGEGSRFCFTLPAAI